MRIVRIFTLHSEETCYRVDSEHRDVFTTSRNAPFISVDGAYIPQLSVVSRQSSEKRQKKDRFVSSNRMIICRDAACCVRHKTALDFKIGNTSFNPAYITQVQP
jgi:hypothetical protein